MQERNCFVNGRPGHKGGGGYRDQLTMSALPTHFISGIPSSLLVETWMGTLAGE